MFEIMEEHKFTDHLTIFTHIFSFEKGAIIYCLLKFQNWMRVFDISKRQVKKPLCTIKMELNEKLRNPITEFTFFCCEMCQRVEWLHPASCCLAGTQRRCFSFWRCNRIYCKVTNISSVYNFIIKRSNVCRSKAV